MSQRFFCKHRIEADEIELDGPEAHHLLHVMRARIGDHVVLFDGSGKEFDVQVSRLGRTQVSLQVISLVESDRELAICLELAVALPKGDRQQWLVEKLVELGVSRFVPLETQRGMGQSKKVSRQKLERAVIEASKQCGRNRLMIVQSSMDIGQYLANTVAPAVRILAHPSDASSLPMPTCDDSGTVCIAIGPEGGFTEDEAQLAMNSGWTCLNLGPRMLRVETAAIALASVYALGRSYD